MRWVGNVLTRRKGVGVFGSALLRREGVRGFGFGIGCLGVIQMTQDGRRQVRVGRIGVGTVTVVTATKTKVQLQSVAVQFNPWSFSGPRTRLCNTIYIMSFPHVPLMEAYWSVNGIILGVLQMSVLSSRSIISRLLTGTYHLDHLPSL